VLAENMASPSRILTIEYPLSISKEISLNFWCKKKQKLSPEEIICQTTHQNIYFCVYHN